MATAVFQTFEDSADGAAGAGRLEKLRRQLAAQGLDGFIVPQADEFQGEYIPPSDRRLAWLTGFSGSWGLAIVLPEVAAVFIDGRYALQVRAQVDLAAFTPVSIETTSVENWIGEHMPAGARIGYDARYTTPATLKRYEDAARRRDATLVATDANPVDTIWTDRPKPPATAVTARELSLAGLSSAEKFARTREAMAREKDSGLLLSDPHDVAWLFNIRGSDVDHTPIARIYAFLPLAGAPVLFVDAARLSAETRAALDASVVVQPPDAMPQVLRDAAVSGQIRCDSASASVYWTRLIEQSGGKVALGMSPVVKLKAIKNAAEIDGMRQAHRRDGHAVTRFLAWFADEAPKGNLSEIDSVEALEGFRRETNALVNVSFPTIAGSGPNGAVIHYRVTRATNRKLEPGELFVLDSGGQYRDGTTDITRTLAVGTPTAEMRDRFTRVLKGHIAVATAVFPHGTPGAQIDAFARRALWDAGEDFDHGTGHGVGAFLSVHEGPARIGKLGTVALEAGMILSNEPGYYKEGAFGIRIENLLLVEPREIPGGSRKMLGFETLTLAPIDRSLIDLALLTTEERGWIDAYHARVRTALEPTLSANEAIFLAEATRPL